MKARKVILLIAASLLSCHLVSAQDLDALGTFTPYSLFGVGDLHSETNATSLGMGGISMGVRDPRYINFRNVASLTERDTLSFMLDLGLYSKNIYLKDKNTKSAYNTVNINNFVISFPIKNKNAMVLGIMPFSNMGYKFQTEETSPELISKYGDIRYRKYGNGNINQVFIGGAAKITDRLSVGLKGIYYFGSQTAHSDIYFTDASLRNIGTGWKHNPHGFSLEAAAQANFRPADDYKITLGATYRMKSKLAGSVTRYSMANDGFTTDTITFARTKDNIHIPAIFIFGASIRKGDKWMMGIDYQRQDWSKSDIAPMAGFKTQAAQSIRTGIEFVPNRYDIRYYYKRITYRAGFHYDKSYVSLDGKSVNQMGITLGASFPVYRLNNSFNVAVDFGQRGSTTGNLVRENYINFIVSISLHDMWFIKPKYQ